MLLNLKFEKLNVMPNSRYQLKAGVLLQAFGDPSKACTNKNLTDALAEWHLINNPGVRKYFAVLPPDAPGVSGPPAGITVVSPIVSGQTRILAPEPPPPPKIIDPPEQIQELLNVVNLPDKPPEKKELKKGKHPSGKRK
jgi:hypothetical protein